MQYLTLLTGFLLIALTACAAERTDVTAIPTPVIPDKIWQITTIDGAPVQAGPTLHVSATGVNGNSGVNTFGGSATVGNSTIAIGPLRMTRRAGSADQMAAEAAYLKALAAVRTWTIAQDVLSLSDADGAVRIMAK